MKVEVRSDCVLLDGYVNAVGRDSRPIPDRRGAFVEQVEPGAFGRALGRGRKVDLKVNHERVLGSNTDGALELYEDNIGLRAKAKVTDAAIIEKARKKQLRGWSFGFAKPVDVWEERTDALPRRYLKDFILNEVTIVDDTKLPAYVATSIETREDETELIEHRISDDTPEYDIEPENPERDDDNPTEPDARTSMASLRARRLKLA